LLFNQELMSDTLIIIPTYNEKENVAKMLHEVFSLEKAYHILVVDDGSPDGTAAIVKELQAEYPTKLFLEERTGKLGLGTAYIHGFQWGLALKYDYFIEMDCDFSHNPDDLIRLYEACAIDGNDLAIGSRYVGGLVNVINWPIGRVMMSYFASRYVKLITGLPLDDSTAGFKCYRRQVLVNVLGSKVTFVGYAFQIEMKFKTWKFGYEIKEVPVIFTDRTAGESKMSTSIFYEAFFGVIQMKLKSLFVSYKQQ
jgi:dolichol-phosphate mannosyltransferase